VRTNSREPPRCRCTLLEDYKTSVTVRSQVPCEQLMSDCIPTRQDLWLGYCESVFRKAAHSGIYCVQSSSALLRVEVRFVPQFVSGSFDALRVKDLAMTIRNPREKSFDIRKRGALCRHLVLLTVRQLGSFPDQLLVGTVGRFVGGCPSQFELSPASDPSEKDWGPHLSRSAAPRQV